MKLKTIRLVGFKSFADETVIELQDGFTCIVGPNGCGKSNILDALRWVLGEKSARGLRGQQMEDLIFLGSNSRKPAGMTEVEVCFDNKDRFWDIDQDELILARRLYVASPSEYYWNGERTTRREIEKIFLDTGIGKSSYSIIEQGSISQLLGVTPETRRALLDEAAGIMRFKLERQQTLQNLEETENNLIRLQDIEKTKKKEIENLEKQAKKTRTYLEWKEKLDQHDQRLRYFKILHLEGKHRIAQEGLDVLMRKREKSLEQTSKLEQQRGTIDQSSQRQMEELLNLERKYHHALALQQSLENNQQRIIKEQKGLQLRIQQLEKQMSKETQKYKATEKQKRETQQLQLNLELDLKNSKKITWIL